jgi:hypothetical protein
LVFKNPTRIQREGSIIFDQRTLKLYYSDGIQWVELVSPETDSDSIVFKTSGLPRAIFNPDGVFIATGGLTDPNLITPTLGKVAHFEGDVDITGVVDPTGVQFTQQSSPPGSLNSPDKGMLYVDTANLGSFNSGTLVYVDSSDT